MPKSFIQAVRRFWRRSTLQLRRWIPARRRLRLCDYICHYHQAILSCRRRLSQARRLTYDFNATGNGQPCSKTHRQSQRTQSHGRLIWIVALVSLTAAMGQSYLYQPRFDIGTVAPRTIYAPFDATVVDEISTENRRQEARTGVTPVLTIDGQATEQTENDLQRLLTRGDEVRGLTQPFPIVASSALSEFAQTVLRDLSDDQWRSLRSQLQAGTFQASDLVQHAPPPAQRWQLNLRRLENWRQAGQRLEELQNQWPSNGIATLGNSFVTPDNNDSVSAMRRNREESTTVPSPLTAGPALPVEVGRYQSLGEFIQGMDGARQRHQSAIAELDRHPQQKVPVLDITLLSLGPDEWGQIKTASRDALQRILLHGLPPGLTDDHRENIVETALAEALEPPLQPMANRLLLSVIKRPNLLQDPVKTKEQAETAAENVELIEVSRQRGELIVAAGDEIDTDQFALLDYYGLSQRGINWWGLLELSGWVAVGLMSFWLVERRFGQRLRRPDHILLLLLALSAPLSGWLTVLLPDRWGYGLIDLPLVGLLAGSFYGPAVGSALCVLLGLLMPLSLGLDWTPLLAMAVAGSVGALMAGRLRSREEFAFLGMGLGLTQGATYFLLSLISSAAASSVWVTLLVFSMLQGVVGLVWSVVALGFSPYLEHLFDLVTPIRLAELANPNRTLLKRLAAEAPGTFQHTLFVASLAEAAARSLGCNVELVRAGTLYHDIGKMHDPLGFIENQMGGPNKHDAINDPWKSAALIKRHVSEGLVMAKKARLPKAIQAFIPEHQGTMCITYFYYQAMQEQEQASQGTNQGGGGSETSVMMAVRSRPVQEADFRYDGPIPQSKETGIVMLADSCEAALRSLKEATYEEALAMVNRILRARWQDNQLVDSGLTRSEMGKIAEVFVRVWQQANHQRIAYPKAALPK